MNNIFKSIILGVTIAFGLSSCGDFLEEASQDEIKPTNTEDVAAVLYSSAYPYLFTTDNYLILLTDEVENHQYKLADYAGRMLKGKPIYTFSKTMFDGEESFINDENSWKNYYSQIKNCNVVLDYVYQMEGTDTDKRHIAGQARTLRAYYYLRLLTIYCMPYKESSLDSEYGLCHILTSRVTDKYPKRETLRATYNLVESELLTAEAELKGYTPTTYYRITQTAAQLLLSRLYLYEQKWDKCIEYATAVIKNGPQLSDFPTLGTSVNVFDPKSTEIIWNYSGGARYGEYILTTNGSTINGGTLPYQLSKTVKDLYAPGDLRNCTSPVPSQRYVTGSDAMGWYARKTLSNSVNGENGLRTSEAYINRAEAYAQQGKVIEAVADLNTLRRNRIHPSVYADLTLTDKDQALQFIRDERQREFVWEGGLRWMDIKRYGFSITHVFTEEDGAQQTYTLEANSPLYALPIPGDAIKKNPDLQQNKR